MILYWLKHVNRPTAQCHCAAQCVHTNICDSTHSCTVHEPVWHVCVCAITDMLSRIKACHSVMQRACRRHTTWHCTSLAFSADAHMLPEEPKVEVQQMHTTPTSCRFARSGVAASPPHVIA